MPSAKQPVTSFREEIGPYERRQPGDLSVPQRSESNRRGALRCAHFTLDVLAEQE
ncbi:MAG: hypothetical protein ABEK84_03855 [Salinibacter sp.]